MRRPDLRPGLVAWLLAGIVTTTALAHNGVVHKTPEEAAAHAAATQGEGAEGKGGATEQAPPPPTPGLPFLVDIRAEFDLIDQEGEPVTQKDFAGKPMAIFFGYANCEAICSVALPRLGAALDILGTDVDLLTPLLITVDPGRDTPEKMGPALAKWHPRLRGLTGSEDALAAARDAFQVQSEKVFDDPEGNPIYSHGSFIYLIGGDGKVLTIMPPILGPERMAEIIKSYL